LGFEILRDQLNLCPLTYDDVLNMMRFGAVTESTCEFELSDLVSLNPDIYPKDANYFFDLYIKDRND
jgi:hypothetical protein